MELINYEAISIRYYEPVFFALVIFHVTLVCAVFYFRVWPIWLYHIFPYYLINGTIFRKKFIEHKMWVLIFSFLILRRIKQGIIICMYVYICMCMCVCVYIHYIYIYIHTHTHTYTHIHTYVFM